MDTITVRYANAATKFPVYPSVAAATITEGDPVTNQTISVPDVTITPVAVAARTRLMKQVLEQGGQQAMADIGRTLARSIVAKQNGDIYALGAGFNGGSTIGTTDVAITEALILQGISQLEAVGALKPFNLGVTPYVYENIRDLYKASVSVTAASIREELYRTGEISSLFGVNLKVITDLPAGTGAGQATQADTICPMYSREAIGAVISQDNIVIDTNWDANYLGWDIVGYQYFGTGEVRDTHGVGLLVNNYDA